MHPNVCASGSNSQTWRDCGGEKHLNPLGIDGNLYRVPLVNQLGISSKIVQILGKIH